MEEIHKWRVIIIMAHDGETYFEYNDLEQSILDNAHFEHLSYTIFYYNQKYDKITIREACIEEKRKYLQELPETIDYKGLKFYNPNTLIKFLTFVRNRHAAESENSNKNIQNHYFLITWGHGGGLYYFPSDIIQNAMKAQGLLTTLGEEQFAGVNFDIRQQIARYARLSSDLSFKGPHTLKNNSKPLFSGIIQHEIEQVSGGPKNVSMIRAASQLDLILRRNFKSYTAADLSMIFEKGLQQQIDILFSLNCYTQMLETGYAYRNIVKMMVAPQTSMPIAGINYSEIFQKLGNSPNISVNDLAPTITGSFLRKYSCKFLENFKNHYPEYDLNIVSFSCNYLTSYGDFIKPIDKLTVLLKDIYHPKTAYNAFKKNVSTARFKCEDLTPEDNSGIIDIHFFLQQLQIHLPEKFRDSITEIKDEFEYIKNNKVLLAIKKPNESEAGPGHYKGVPLFLSFFAPANTKAENISTLLSIYKSKRNEFGRTSKWGKFVKTFHDDTLTP